MNRDYTFMWWRDGFNRGAQQMNFRTGYYGMAFDNIHGGLCRFGTVEGLSEEEAQAADNSDIDALPRIKMEISLSEDGNMRRCTGLAQIDMWGAHSRIIEMGHCTDRMDAMYYVFEGSDVLGRFELAAFPRFASLSVSGFSHAGVAGLAFELRLELPFRHVKTTAESVVFEGLTLLLHGCAARYEQGMLYLTGRPGYLEADVFGGGFSVDLLPCGITEDYMRDLGNVQVSASEMRSGEMLEVHRGYNGSVYIDTAHLTGNIDFAKEENRRYYERVLITLHNPGQRRLLLPVCFAKDGALFPTSGVCPILREVDGEPCGIQVQLSKNWHRLSTDRSSIFYAAANDPKRLLEGPWLHAWSNIPLEPGQTLRLEYDCLYASWGTVWSASHSQLCLAGWGGAYQLWESSAIGSFGEAFCYDAETSHGRAFIDDIRPLTVYTKNDITQKPYQWTGCNGGGNFLLYFDKTGAQVPLVNIRVWFKKQGPNLCEVIYKGETRDGAVSCTFKANLPRTDDCSRAIHSFRYVFNKDTEFSRFVLYQLGADHYNDNDYPRLCIGNDDGPVGFELDGVRYDGEFASPVSDTPGYPGGSQQPIEVPGEGLFIACLGARMTNTNDCKFGPVANRTLVLRSFEGSINGKRYTKPFVSLYRTVDFDVPCIAQELCLPPVPYVKAGSTVEGVVEYINLPVKKQYYYGTSRIMRAFDENEFDSWRLAARYNTQGRISVSMISGELLQGYPVEVLCRDGSAELVISGGLSYLPVTFKGLPDRYGYKLYVDYGEGLNVLDQSDNGSDFKQCYQGRDGWELTFNVELYGGKCRLLIKK